jgi:hypothetical protein
MMFWRMEQRTERFCRFWRSTQDGCEDGRQNGLFVSWQCVVIYLKDALRRKRPVSG